MSRYLIQYVCLFQRRKPATKTPRKAHFSKYITLTTPRPTTPSTTTTTTTMTTTTSTTSRVFIRTSQPVHQREWEPISHLDRPQAWSAPNHHHQTNKHHKTNMHQLVTSKHQNAPDMNSVKHQKPGAGNGVVPQEIHYKSQYIIISPGQPALFPITPGPMKIMKEGGGEMFATTPPPILEAAYYPPTTPYPAPSTYPPLTTLPSNPPKRHTGDSPHLSNQVS